MGLNNGVVVDELTADAVCLDNTTTSIKATELQGTIEEMRKQLVLEPEITTTTLNGNLNLTVDSNTLQILNGTATGFTVNLPDATTIFEGQRFELANDSNQTVLLKDDAGTLLGQFIEGDVIMATLEDNATAAGEWILLVISSIASGVQAFNVASDTPFVVGATSDTLITGMAITPVTGTYGVWFSADITIAANNKIGQCVIFKDGVAVENSRRNYQGVSSNFECVMPTLGIIQVNGAQALDIRVNVNGSTMTINQRSLLVIRLGQ